MIIPPLIMLVLGAITLSIYLPNLVTRDQIQVFEDRLITETKAIGRSVATQWVGNKRLSQYDRLAEEWGNHFGGNVLILSPAGEVLGASSDTGMDEFLIYRQEIQQAILSGTGSATGISEETENPVIYTAAEISLDGDSLGFVHLTYELTQTSALKRNLRATVWVSFAILGLLLATPVYLLTKRSGNRLVSITQAANQIAAGNRDIQIPTGIRDEIGAAVHAINQLAQQLNAQFNALEIEQAKINAVLLHMDEGVMIVNTQGEILLANQSVLDLFRIEESNVTGQRIVRVIPYHQIIDLWQEYSNTGQDQVSTIELADQNKIIQVSLSPLGESMEGFSLLVFQDLTQLRQLETVRRDFISNISHELRTPLASLKALAETLQISALEDPEAARRFLDRMDREIDALSQMVSELLELSRIESGQVPLNLKVIDANAILLNTLDRLVVQAERADISLRAKTKDERLTILADPPRLEQVLMNILHNAIKFTPEGGKVRASVYSQGYQVIFRIKDTGGGIPFEDLPRIFERFYKSKRPKQGSGTGLGLAIAKHLVEAHGGKIWAESRPGRGSTFYISLPKHIN